MPKDSEVLSQSIVDPHAGPNGSPGSAETLFMAAVSRPCRSLTFSCDLTTEL